MVRPRAAAVAGETPTPQGFCRGLLETLHPIHHFSLTRYHDVCRIPRRRQWQGLSAHSDWKTDEARLRTLPEVERLIKLHGKVRMLVHMHEFHGWKLSALWEDVKFDVKHFAHIERLALVGEKKWEAGMAVFCKPFTTAAVRYFDAADYDKALAWLNERVGQPV